jgi:hypothetical protein
MQCLCHIIRVPCVATLIYQDARWPCLIRIVYESREAVEASTRIFLLAHLMRHERWAARIMKHRFRGAAFEELLMRWARVALRFSFPADGKMADDVVVKAVATHQNNNDDDTAAAAAAADNSTVFQNRIEFSARFTVKEAHILLAHCVYLFVVLISGGTEQRNNNLKRLCVCNAVDLVAGLLQHPFYDVSHAALTFMLRVTSAKHQRLLLIERLSRVHHGGRWLGLRLGLPWPTICLVVSSCESYVRVGKYARKRDARIAVAFQVLLQLCRTDVTRAMIAELAAFHRNLLHEVLGQHQHAVSGTLAPHVCSHYDWLAPSLLPYDSVSATAAFTSNDDDNNKVGWGTAVNLQPCDLKTCGKMERRAYEFRRCPNCDKASYCCQSHMLVARKSWHSGECFQDEQTKKTKRSKQKKKAAAAALQQRRRKPKQKAQLVTRYI